MKTGDGILLRLLLTVTCLAYGFGGEEVKSRTNNSPTIANHVGQPWNVGIYWVNQNPDGTQKYRYVCGGSLITPNRVLTAAHCGYDNSVEKWRSPEDIYITLGKLKMAWEVSEGNHTQRLGVTEFRRPPEYTGRKGFHSFDIAMIILESPATVSELVYPVSLNFEPKRFGAGAVGKLPSWETTGTNGVGENLHEMNVPFIGRDECLSLVSNDERKSITSDKFCGGYKDKGPKAGRGDGGSGLVYEEGQKHYLVGIPSTTLKKNDFWITFYTNICDHAPWIRENMGQ